MAAAAGVLYNASRREACYAVPADPNYDGIWDYQSALKRPRARPQAGDPFAAVYCRAAECCRSVLLPPPRVVFAMRPTRPPALVQVVH